MPRIPSHRLALLALGLAALLLAGCAATRPLDSTVQSYSSLTALPSPPTYRLEKLPSQQAEGAPFTTIEAAAQQALEHVGLRRDDERASLVLQLGVQASSALADWPHYTSPPGWGWGLGWGGWGRSGFGMAFLFDRPPMLYRRSITLVLRESSTQRVVYETSARYEDIWSDDATIYRALFDAALNGFPNPPAGPRAIRTEVPR